MSYYRNMPIDVRVALWFGKPLVRQWFGRVLCVLPAILLLAIGARWIGLGIEPSRSVRFDVPPGHSICWDKTGAWIEPGRTCHARTPSGVDFYPDLEFKGGEWKKAGQPI